MTGALCVGSTIGQYNIINWLSFDKCARAVASQWLQMGHIHTKHTANMTGINFDICHCRHRASVAIIIFYLRCRRLNRTMKHIRTHVRVHQVKCSQPHESNHNNNKMKSNRIILHIYIILYWWNFNLFNHICNSTQKNS